MLSRFVIVLLVLGFAALPLPAKMPVIGASCAEAENCGGCPPAYCHNPAAAKKAKDKKAREAESQGLPKRLSKLFYQLPDCVGCVELAPDWVTLAWEIDPEAMAKVRGGKMKFTKHWQPWSSELEWKLRQQMEQGLVKQVHFMVQSGARCRCCKPGEYKAFKYRMGEDAKDARKVDDGKRVPGYNTDFEYYKPYGKRLTNPGDYPKDLNEVPESLRYPDQIKMPKLRMPPAERSITQPCPKCRKQAEDYNDTVHAINDLRRPLAKAEQNAGFYSKVSAYAWRAYSATQYIADFAVREKKEAEALKLYQTRLKQWEEAKADYKKLKEKWDKLKAKLKPLFTALLECEETCRAPEPKQDHVLGDDDIEIELEQAISVTGSNAFDSYEIQRIPEMVNGADASNPVVLVTPVPVGTTTPVTPTVPTSPATPTTPTTPVTTPLAVTASGSVTFAHVVGTSSCPQSAGTVAVSSNNGNALTVSGVSTSGTLATRIDTSVSGNGSATPMISANFNCSSADNGSFSGSVTGTVTDSVTNETATFSVPASGTVTGP